MLQLNFPHGDGDMSGADDVNILIREDTFDSMGVRFLKSLKRLRGFKQYFHLNPMEKWNVDKALQAHWAVYAFPNLRFRGCLKNVCSWF